MRFQYNVGGWNWKNKSRILIKQIFKDKKEKRSCLRCAVVDHNALGSCITIKKIVLYLFRFILNLHFSLNTFSKTIKTNNKFQKNYFWCKVHWQPFHNFYPFTCHIHMLKLTKKNDVIKWTTMFSRWCLI